MTVSQRRQLISAQAAATGKVSVAGLAAQFETSEMTIRRDLDALEAEGLVRRVFGGAIPAISRSYEPPFAQRASSAHPAKVAIGQAAAALVHSGETVIIDVGTTALEVARALHGAQGLTVVTASLPVANELANDQGIRVIVTGGEIRAGELSLTGGMAEDAFALYNCDLAIIGVAGVCSTPGFTEYNPEDARVKKAAIRNARRTIVVVDSSKLGVVAFTTVAPLMDVDALVTDAEAGDEAVAELGAAGLEVIQAPQHHDGELEAAA